MEYSKLKPCVYGGSESCVRQGGSGSQFHARQYTHPWPQVAEVGAPVGAFVEPLEKANRVEEMNLYDFFDDDLAEACLSVEMDMGVNPESLIRKSIYDFDLTSDEGIERLMALLPILDEEILMTLVQEVWPGYPVEENFNPMFTRLEIRAFLLDYLNGEDEEE
jgi:hypothetical protein